MVKVIINADDLGNSHEVNMAIGEALRNHYITSSTIMANSTTWGEVHLIVEENPQASFGLHLNLTDGKALTQSKVLLEAGIVDENNNFTKKVRSIEKFSPKLLDAIFNEWDAQVNKVVNIEGVKITHFDGHHHIHADYPFRNILCKLLDKYDIHIVRNRYRRPLSFSFKVIVVISDILAFFPKLQLPFKFKISNIINNEIECSRWRKQLKKIAVIPEYFEDYELFITDLKRGRLPKLNCCIELMCHPGNPRYKEEYNLIQNRELNNCLKNYISINYKTI